MVGNSIMLLFFPTGRSVEGIPAGVYIFNRK